MKVICVYIYLILSADAVSTTWGIKTTAIATPNLFYVAMSLDLYEFKTKIQNCNSSKIFQPEVTKTISEI